MDGGKESGWPIQHLPPILLQVSLPSTYPSEQPPGVHLSAMWLTPSQLQQLQQHLLDMWNGASGFPICYTWVDWLQQDALEHLGISDSLDLSQFASAGTPDRSHNNGCCQHAAGSDSEHDQQHLHHHDPCQSATPEEVLMNLLRFNAAEKQHAFRDGTWSCGICFEQFPGRSCVQASLQCGHVYCKGCMAQHCGLHVREGSLEFLRCPEPGCKEPLDRQVCCLSRPNTPTQELQSLRLHMISMICSPWPSALLC